MPPVPVKGRISKPKAKPSPRIPLRKKPEPKKNDPRGIFDVTPPLAPAAPVKVVAADKKRKPMPKGRDTPLGVVEPGPLRPFVLDEALESAAPRTFSKDPKGDAAKAKMTAAQRKAQAKIDAYNDEVFTARQDRDVKAAIVRRVGAQAGLTPPGSPFAGMEDGKGPGAKRPEWITEATAKSTLARINSHRLTHGGLAPTEPARSLPGTRGKADSPGAEERAMETLASSRALTFKDRHRLPFYRSDMPGDPGIDLAAKPLPKMSLAEIAEMLRGDKPQVQRRRGEGEPRTDAGGAIKGYDTDQEGIDFDPRMISKGAVGIAQAAGSDAVADMAGRLWAKTPMGKIGQIGTMLPKQIAKLAASPGGAVPHIAIPWDDLDPRVQEAIAADGGQRPTIHLDEIEQYGDYVLGAEARKPLVEMAVKNGHKRQDAATWNDAELAARAFTKFDVSTEGFLRNLANDVGSMAALANAPAMMATSIRQAIKEGSVAPALEPGKALGQGFLDVLPGTGDRPWLRNLYDRPFSTVTAVTPVGRFVGLKVGRFGTRRGNPIIKPTRSITLPTTGHTVNVPRSQEPVMRAVQVARDAILQRGAGPVARQAERSVDDKPSVKGAVKGVVQRAGHRMEQNETNRMMRRFHQEAQLQAGQDPSVLLNMMVASVRDLDDSLKDMIPFKTGLGKQTRAEAIAHHHGAATESEVLIDYFTGLAEDSKASATRLRDDLEVQVKARDDLQAAGNTERAAEYQAQINATENQIIKHEQEQMMQERLAEFSRNNAIDVLTPGSEKEGAAVYAMTMVSLAKTKLLMDAGKIDEAGQLWGDWSKRLQVVHRMEAPNSPRAIKLGQPDGTDAWHLADAILNPDTGLRAQHKGLRDDVAGTMLADASSPAAQQALGRSRAARKILQGIEKREAAADNALARAQESTMGRSQEAVSDPVEATVVSRHRTPEKAKEVARTRAARTPDMRVSVRKGKDAKGREVYEVREKPKFKPEPESYDASVVAERVADAAGVGAGVIRSIRQAAERLHGDKRTRAAKAVQKQEKYVADLEATERAAHGKVSSAAVRSAEAELNRMLLSRGSPRENAILEVGKSLTEHGLTTPDAIRIGIERMRKAAPEGSMDKVMVEDLLDDGRLTEETVYALQQATKGRYNPKGMAVRPARIEAQRAKVQALRDAEATEFIPSTKLAKGMAELENMRDFLEEGISLKASEVQKIIDQIATPAQRAALKDAKMADLIMAGLHAARSKELGILRDRAQRIYDEASARYEQIAGSAADMRLRSEDVRGDYVTALRRFAENQINEGRRGFHTNLHMPGDEGKSVVRESLEDYQWRSGNFTLDQHLYLARDLEGAAREAVKSQLYKIASDSPLVIENAIPHTKVEPGWLLVKAEAYHLLKKPQRTADENASLVQMWVQESKRVRSGATVPDDGVPYSMITEDAYNWIKETMSGPGRFDDGKLNTALELTNMYRRWMLFTVPRTFVNNAIGNPILAMMAGAGPLTYYRSLHIIRKHPELIPKTLRHVGPIANLLDSGAAKMVGYQAFWRNANVMMEDNGRFMVYLMHATRAYKKDNAIAWFKRVDMADQKMVQFLDDLAHGKDARVHDFAEFGVQWFGDMARNFKHDNALATAFLFHRWVMHMIHLTLWTMPVKYPGRTAFLQQTAVLADQYRKEHGAFPEWATSMIPLWDQVDTVLGKAQTVTWALSSGGFLPQSTPGQTFDLGSAGQPKAPLQSLVAANITPPLRIFMEQTIGRRLDTLEPFMDRYGNEVGPMSWRVTANSLIANTPVVNSLLIRQGLSDDSIQGYDEAPRYEKRAVGNEQFRSPRALGHGTFYDNLLRLGGLLGVTLRPIDNEGERTKAKAYGSIAYQNQEFKKRDARTGKQKYLDDLKEYERDPEKWKREHGGLTP